MIWKNFLVISTKIQFQIIHECESSSKQFGPDEIALTDLVPPKDIDEKVSGAVEKWRIQARQDIKTKVFTKLNLFLFHE